MRTSAGFELTYCTNIHAADGWAQVLENVRRYAPDLKRRLNPDGRFGLGLRLANSEACELLTGNALAEFSEFLSDAGIYVALINGFPYGSFHTHPLKDDVFAPDWHTQERVDYTLRLVKILQTLLPEDLDGGVSTCPLSYKRWHVAGRPDWALLIRNVIEVVDAMFNVKRRHGRILHLDIEPEPDGLVETTTEFIEFFRELLHIGGPLLAQSAQIPLSQAEEAIREHLALCYDLCHSAVQHETLVSTLGAIASAGIRIGRIQISSAIKVSIPDSEVQRTQLGERLAAFADPVYLHQIVGKSERFPDLPGGLAQLEHTNDTEWRIHYHVPLFIREYETLSSTQSEVQAALSALTKQNVRHLEIETYTWNVLPEDLKLDIASSIEREYRWVLSQL